MYKLNKIMDIYKIIYLLQLILISEILDLYQLYPKFYILSYNCELVKAK